MNSGKQSMFRLASLALAMFVYVALAWVVYQSYYPAPPDFKLFLPELRSRVRPEPQERLCYLLGLACIVVLPALFWLALVRWNRLRPKDWAWLQSPRVLWGRDLALAGGLALWLAWLAIHTEMPDAKLRFGLALAILPLLIYFARRSLPSSRYGVHILAGIVLCLLTGLLVVADEMWFLRNPTISANFELLMGAVNQVRHGRTILVDTASQYGIGYPYVAAAILATGELTVTRLSLFFAGVSLLTLALLYWMVCEKVGYRTYWSLLLLIPILAVTHPFFGSGWFDPDAYWIYYQYHPLRVLCGAFFLAFVPWYFRHQTPGWMALGYAAAGFSLLWNLDTGIIILVAWTGVLVLDQLARRPIAILRLLGGIALHGGLFMLTAAGAYATYAIWARFRSGRFPQPDLFVKYQNIFYGAGFMMLPMRLWEWWQPVVLIYVVTIAECLRRVIRGTGDVRVRWYFFIAAYGLGIFSYYQGRSHISCLLGVVYPAMILAGFYVIDLLRRLPKGLSWARFRDPGWRYAMIRLAACGLFVAAGAVHCALCMPSLMCLTPPLDIRQEDALAVERAGLDLRRYLDDTPCIILSPFSNYLHLKSGSYSALPFCSPGEVMLAEQLRDVQDVLDRSDTQYVVTQAVPGSNIWSLKRLRFDRFHVVRRYGADIVLLKKT